MLPGGKDGLSFLTNFKLSINKNRRIERFAYFYLVYDYLVINQVQIHRKGTNFIAHSIFDRINGESSHLLGQFWALKLVQYCTT